MDSAPHDILQSAVTSTNFRSWLSDSSLLIFVVGALVFFAVQRLLDGIYDTALVPATEKVFGVTKISDQCAAEEKALKDDPENAPPLSVQCTDRLLAIQWRKLGATVLQTGLILGIAFAFTRKRSDRFIGGL